MFNERNGTLYTGVTGNLLQRIHEHKNAVHPKSFTARYKCNKLGFFEEFQYINDALEYEKYIKSKSRKYKISLIESINPEWVDLSEQDMFWIRL